MNTLLQLASVLSIVVLPAALDPVPSVAESTSPSDPKIVVDEATIVMCESTETDQESQNEQPTSDHPCDALKAQYAACADEHCSGDSSGKCKPCVHEQADLMVCVLEELDRASDALIKAAARLHEGHTHAE